VAGLDVTARVLLIGAHPDDEDTQLLTWLARGRQVETAYLSLTRGDGGQNLIGNELGPLLGMIRTEELLAARRLDGGRQYFTRAYDFGFSKTAEETYTHWPKDSILRDVVTVVRAFRPHVIVAVFSGTPRDGHGHHQVSGLLAREAFDAASDTVRFPTRGTFGLGPWSPAKFYRAARFAPGEATMRFNVGELSVLRGQTYAELASLSRSQHLSQGFGMLQRRGAALDYLKLEVSRLRPVREERSPLDGIDATWGRFAATPMGAAPRAALDSLPVAIGAVRAVENLTAPAPMIAPLARVARLLATARSGLVCGRGPCGGESVGTDQPTGDLATSLETASRRATTALLAASGVLVEATAPRELLAVGDTLSVTVAVYNQGTVPVTLDSVAVRTASRFSPSVAIGADVRVDSAARATVPLVGDVALGPPWLEIGRVGDIFVLPGAGSAAARNMTAGEDRTAGTYARAVVRIAGVPVSVDAGPVVYRYADPARGERRRPLAVVPPISVRFSNALQFARANLVLHRSVRVHLKSSTTVARAVTVTLGLPPGLTADSLVRRVALEPMGEATLVFHVDGALPDGRHYISATASAGEATFRLGWDLIEYEHIRPLRYYQMALTQIQAVTAQLPPNPRIAYINGVGDNVAPHLSELGLAVTTIAPDRFAETDLSAFRAIVLGPRAFAANPVLAAQAPRLQAYARAGGTVVVQYGQQEMQLPGLLPYPISIKSLAERVTDETAPVTLLAPGAQVLSSPNTLSAADFADWVQERASYMPTTADPHWQRLLEMHDPNEPRNENALLVARVGRGAYVYTTLALFRQIPAGVPGAARLFLNLVGADGRDQAASSLRR
jgi:LmbE family N-acetylglucosaminyl deacetylase